MIASFRSKALERFWTRGETRRVNPAHVKKLRLILGLLDDADRPEGWMFRASVSIPSQGIKMAAMP